MTRKKSPIGDFSFPITSTKKARQRLRVARALEELSTPARIHWPVIGSRSSECRRAMNHHPIISNGPPSRSSGPTSANERQHRVVSGCGNAPPVGGPDPVGPTLSRSHQPQMSSWMFAPRERGCAQATLGKDMMNNHQRVDRRRAALKAIHERSTGRKRRRATARKRDLRKSAQATVEAQPWVAALVDESRRNGLTLHVAPIQGNASGLHFRWMLRGIHVADYWPTSGRLNIGGRAHWPEDASEAMRIVVQQIGVVKS